ncbi:hypothetical protein EJB05_04743 [Eragrostis curvula]|uniref:Protein EARLY FLOWERING 4 domain-containing protein n=1 Tax=Eragrostis curvula TaxID=38414 RepID=A0A5J9W979_9POAL|nr:hypothetical protein EJB05_04743 [Eragrostis curvula]
MKILLLQVQHLTPCKPPTFPLLSSTAVSNSDVDLPRRVERALPPRFPEIPLLYAVPTAADLRDFVSAGQLSGGRFASCLASMDQNGGVGNGNNDQQAFPARAACNGNGNGVKLPQVLQQSFGEVQGILEHNRVLIQEISQNQESGDADGLTRNVALIRELNTNIARVVDLYADLSGSFARSVTTNNANAAGPKRPRSNEA